MPNKLIITILSGVLALVGLPAFAFDLPDSGSKNFSPPSDTPSYLSNENAPVSARIADTTARDWSAVDALVPERTPAPSARQGSRGHDNYSSTLRSARRDWSKSSGKRQSTRFTAASARNIAGQTKAARKKSVWTGSAKSTAKSTAPNAAKTRTAKHGKLSTRHARAEISNAGAVG